MVTRGSNISVGQGFREAVSLVPERLLTAGSIAGSVTPWPPGIATVGSSPRTAAVVGNDTVAGPRHLGLLCEQLEEQTVNKVWAYGGGQKRQQARSESRV